MFSVLLFIIVIKHLLLLLQTYFLLGTLLIKFKTIQKNKIEQNLEEF